MLTRSHALVALLGVATGAIAGIVGATSFRTSVSPAASAPTALPIASVCPPAVSVATPCPEPTEKPITTQPTEVKRTTTPRSRTVPAPTKSPLEGRQ